MKKFTLYLLLIVISMTIGIPILFLTAHVIKDSAALYGVGFIATLPKSTVIFALGLIGLLRAMGKPNDEKESDKDLADKLGELITNGVVKALVVLFCWGSFYIIHLFL
jgi:hypothetical protein